MSLEKARIIAQIVATVALPVVIALVGHWFSSAMKQKELGLQYTKLVVQILSSDPSGAAEGRAFRQWAIDVLEEYSGVAFPSSQGGDLLRYQLRIAGAVTDSSDIARQAAREGESDEQRD